MPTVTRCSLGFSRSGCVLLRPVSKSYDSVTPKRRPAIRGVLAVTAIVTIFGASVSAAQEVDVEPVTAVVAQATLTIPTTTSTTTVAPTTTAAPATTAAPVVAADEAPIVDELVELSSEDAAPAGYALIDPVDLELPADLESPADLDDAESDAPQNLSLADAAAPSDEILELVARVEEKDRQIAVLSEQLAYLRQAQLTNQVASDPGVDVGSLSTKARLTRAENAAAMDLWRAGYTLGGGRNLPAFENTILPCESGSQPNPDTAVGRTDDWGRSQINRPTWKKRFESLTGADFETGIINPTLNGFMAAHVEQEQGLTAWTCWRKR